MNATENDCFLAANQLNPADNLNIAHLLQCPASHTDLHLSEDRSELISNGGRAGISRSKPDTDHDHSGSENTLQA